MDPSWEYVNFSGCFRGGRRGGRDGCGWARALAIGTFDGLHRGHQELIRRVRVAAHERDLESCVMTFDPHPLQLLSPDGGPRLLMGLQDKLDFMAGLGVDAAIVQTFDAPFAGLSPEGFARYLREELDAAYVVVGFNYTFGRYGAGRADDLREFGKRFGFEVDVVPALMHDGAPISSTRVRQALDAGDGAYADALLGYHLAG